MRALATLLPILLAANSIAVSAEASAWSIDRPVDRIPNHPLSGQLFGNDFELGSATINEYAITLQAAGGRGFGDTAQLVIFVGTDDLKKEMVITPESEGMLPHIHMSFPNKPRSLTGVLMFTEQYSMRLEVVSRTKSEVKLRLHVSLPDYKKSHLIGTFTAQVE